MRVLVGCEFSGKVRDTFIARGHDAMSCDLLPTEAPGPHHQGDIAGILGDRWDMLIAFPTCTYMANSGSKHLYKGMKKTNGIDQERWRSMEAAAAFFRKLWGCKIPQIAIENPIMHGHAKTLIGVSQTQIIQPWQFGHGETKATCLWLKNLPLLQPTNIVSGREARIHRMPPSKDRGKKRSTTYQGIADAMAEQWG